MTNAGLFEIMCKRSSVHTIQNYPTTKTLFKLILKNFKQVREALTDIEKWLNVNDYAWDWPLDAILLGYYMRTQYSMCWDTIKEEWGVI